MSREDFEGLKAYAKVKHDSRVAQMPKRIEFAKHELSKAGFEFDLCNEVNGQINVKIGSKTIGTIWVGTGKWLSINQKTWGRGIKSFIERLKAVAK